MSEDTNMPRQNETSDPVWCPSLLWALRCSCSVVPSFDCLTLYLSDLSLAQMREQLFRKEHDSFSHHVLSHPPHYQQQGPPMHPPMPPYHQVCFTPFSETNVVSEATPRFKALPIFFYFPLGSFQPSRRRGRSSRRSDGSFSGLALRTS